MRRRLQVLFVAYLAVLGYGVFGPSPGEEINEAAQRLRDVQAEVRDRIGVSSTTSTEAPPTTAPPTPTLPIELPSTTVAPAAPAVREDDRWFDDVEAEEAANAAVFVPVGFLLPLCWPRWRWFAVLAGAQLSGLVELVQDVFLDWRTPTVTDVRWNTLGTAIGFALWLGLLAAAPRLVARLSAD
jgi:hypothetical protein